MITPTRPEIAITPQAPMRRRLNVERVIDPRVARRLFFDDDRNTLERQNTIPLTIINEEEFPIATPQPLTRQNTIPLDWAPRPRDEFNVDILEDIPRIPVLRRVDVNAVNYEIRRLQREIPLEWTSDDDEEDIIQIMRSDDEVDMVLDDDDEEGVNEWEFYGSEDEFDMFDE
jgi:hypothetical protein